MAMHDPDAAPIHVTSTDTVIPLHTEELSVTRREMVRGTVRVDVTTHLREQIVDEMLTHERVQVERVAIGRLIDVVPDVRQDGDMTIVPVVEEVVVTERRLMLTEEIHIRRIRTTERHHETVVLRTQRVDVARTGPESSGN